MTADRAPRERGPYEPVEFPSLGATLRGRLYLPDRSSGRHPALIMAHGFSATITGMVADVYAEAFRGSGCAVLLYDHRNLGLSGGEPRQEINRWAQTRGYLDALEFLRGRPDIEGSRIGLWGDSASAGEAIAAAAIDPRVKVVIAQVPACGSSPPPPDPDGSLFAAVRERIVHGDLRSDPAHLAGPMPIVSPDQHRQPSLLTPLTAFRWFVEYGGRFGTGWENWGSVGAPPSPVPLHPALCAPHLRARLLALIATGDEMPGAEEAISRMTYECVPGDKELHPLDGGHFGLLWHPGPIFDEASRIQRGFLERHLL